MEKEERDRIISRICEGSISESQLTKYPASIDALFKMFSRHSYYAGVPIQDHTLTAPIATVVYINFDYVQKYGKPVAGTNMTINYLEHNEDSYYRKYDG